LGAVAYDPKVVQIWDGNGALARQARVRVMDLIREMDDGRLRRLARPGFPDDLPRTLSSHHTRNFM
jgi:hypothetical protein